MKPKRKRPRDLNQLAHAILREATGESEPGADDDVPKKNPAAVALGKLGGARGGKARAKRMTAKQRSAAARKAAKARWKATKRK